MDDINKNKSLTKILCPILIIVFLMLLVVFNGSKISLIADAFKPLLYAFVIAYLLDSIVRFCIVKLKVRRSQGILLACIVILGLIAFMFSIIVPKVIENINYVVDFILNENIDIGQIMENLRSKIDNQHLQYMADIILKAGESLQDRINSILLQLSNQVLQMITSFGSKAFSMFTSFIISIYMLNEKDDLIARGKRLLYALYSETKAKKIINTGRKANSIFKSFLNGKILDSFIVGAVCIIAFTIAQIKNAVLFGIVVGVFNIIPFFGPIIGAVPVVVVTFFINPAKALTTLIIIIVIQQIDANYLDPRIVGNNVGVSPFWILAAVIVGGALGGIPGMIFGVPVVVLLKTILEEYIDMRLIEKGICDLEKDKLKVQKTKNNKRDA
nr:AI-2E family transporter [Sedimentibacter sp.]